ncbi:3-deoxy-D-manno-octulosonate 8-phosphate phosphatase [Corynebacterium sp. CTNIH16]|uniref:3-deoxy-D-manno-octulosonate 8-phosphate phosphatase n=1 Tax=Corynebacterium sp. CTNIH16 TaxID=3068968 RepID=UPI0029350AAE|nr:3-deoxy-D-manno-octulosonate 8-phosphate phosphatase [Corynebacterium sp. CTNIH16]MDV2427107.1 3-deoxy-D-manno-octulosonate 8-phosphate phosphatase [Corynebacterium sp. CTNIH16]
MLSLIDQRDELNEKIGEVSQSIIDLGEAKEFVREIVGMSQRDFNAMLKTAKESSPSVNASPREDESHTDDSERQDDNEAASATKGAGGDGDHEKGGQ